MMQDTILGVGGSIGNQLAKELLLKGKNVRLVSRSGFSLDKTLTFKNAIEACKVNKAKLIFFDNVYMYGKVDGKMTEETPYSSL